MAPRRPWRPAPRQGRGRLRAGAVIALTALLAAGCVQAPPRAPVETLGAGTPRQTQAPVSRAGAPDRHVVVRGDTLYGIAWAHDLDHRRLAAWNEVRAPYTIYPGQTLRLTPPPGFAAAPPPPDPPRASPPASRAPPSPSPAASAPASRAPAREASAREASAREAKPAARPTNARWDPQSKLSWSWPAHGAIERKFAVDGSKGVDISGRNGQAVRAAAPGKVVYSGSGLRGYGKLIIVKHNNSHLSAYGHNDRLLVKEGDFVEGGARIATMGAAGDGRGRLHFQIRRSGKPVDPLRYLPKWRPPEESADA